MWIWIKLLFKLIQQNDANYFRLIPKPKGYKKIDEDIYELGPYSLYKFTFFTVWNRELLIKLLSMYDNPWKFEVLEPHEYTEKFIQSTNYIYTSYSG